MTVQVSGDISLLRQIATRVGGPAPSGLDPLFALVQAQVLATGAHLFLAGDRNAAEYFVLSGVLRSYVADAEGREVTLGFHAGPAILTPSVARTEAGLSLVACQALRPARLMRFAWADLNSLMVADAEVRHWGNLVLEGELIRRARREWSLAAESAAERLKRFEKDFPGLDDQVPQHLIASYLGITASSLSRLRRG